MFYHQCATIKLDNRVSSCSSTASLYRIFLVLLVGTFSKMVLFCSNDNARYILISKGPIKAGRLEAKLRFILVLVSISILGLGLSEKN